MQSHVEPVNSSYCWTFAKKFIATSCQSRSYKITWFFLFFCVKIININKLIEFFIFSKQMLLNLWNVFAKDYTRHLGQFSSYLARPENRWFQKFFLIKARNKPFVVLSVCFEIDYTRETIQETQLDSRPWSIECLLTT